MLHLDNLPRSRPGEQPVLFLRGHWILILKMLLLTAVAIVAPIVVLWLLGYTAPTLLNGPGGDAIVTVFLSIYSLAVVSFFFQEFIDYYLDTWIVTTERVMDIEQRGLFNRTAAEMHIALVQDATTEIRGMLGTFLDYGHVFVQTAGEQRRFTFKNVTHPEQIRNTILRLAEEDRAREHHNISVVTPVSPT